MSRYPKPMGEVSNDQLAQAIKGLHGCNSEWEKAVSVHEKFKGKTVWKGAVQVFRLIGHSSAAICYAWSHEAEDGKRSFVAVLHQGGVGTPEAAVRVSIADEFRGG